MIGEVTRRSEVLPFKAFVQIHSSVLNKWRTTLRGIATGVGFDVCDTSRRFHDQVHLRRNRDRMFVKIIVLKGKISIEFEKQHGSVIKMTPLRFLKFIIGELDKLMTIEQQTDE